MRIKCFSTVCSISGMGIKLHIRLSINGVIGFFKGALVVALYLIVL